MSASVALWCPAYPVPPARWEPACAAAERFAADLGHALVGQATSWTGEGSWPPAELRRTELRQLLHHDLLLAARGGYGCLDLLEVLAAWSGRLPGLIGYSDLTVLHAAWAVRGGPETIYGFMPGVPHGDRARESALALCRGDGVRWDDRQLPEALAVQAGVATGPLFAGCLRVLVGLVGTPWMPSLRGRILALEDIDERPYRIDRDLTQLHLAGCLDEMVALVTNGFPCALSDGYRGPTSKAIIAGWAARLGIPAIFGLPFGHHADPLALPCGRTARMNVAADQWSLEIASR